jgi:hypothetical protein
MALMLSLWVWDRRDSNCIVIKVAARTITREPAATKVGRTDFLYVWLRGDDDIVISLLDVDGLSW